MRLWQNTVKSFCEKSLWAAKLLNRDAQTMGLNVCHGAPIRQNCFVEPSIHGQRERHGGETTETSPALHHNCYAATIRPCLHIPYASSSIPRQYLQAS